MLVSVSREKIYSKTSGSVKKISLVLKFFESLKHPTGEFMGFPIVAKGWPCGVLRPTPAVLVVCNVDGERKSVEDLVTGQDCKILTLSTPHENYEWLYCSDKGKLLKLT